MADTTSRTPPLSNACWEANNSGGCGGNMPRRSPASAGESRMPHLPSRSARVAERINPDAWVTEDDVRQGLQGTSRRSRGAGPARRIPPAARRRSRPAGRTGRPACARRGRRRPTPSRRPKARTDEERRSRVDRPFPSRATSNVMGDSGAPLRSQGAIISLCRIGLYRVLRFAVCAGTRLRDAGRAGAVAEAGHRARCTAGGRTVAAGATTFRMRHRSDHHRRDRP